MNYDIPKVVIVQQQQPEARPFYQIVQDDKSSNNYAATGPAGPQPEAPDLGGYPVTTISGGTGGTASNVSAAMVGPNPGFDFGRSVYIIPRDGPILEVEVDQQIEAANLSEQAELRTK
jgi:hypothetical protein